MRQSYKNWTVRGLLRERVDWTMDGEPFVEVPGGGGRELAVVIFDEGRGWKVEATLNDDRDEVMSLRVDDPGGIAQRELQGLPLGWIRDAARGYINRYERYREEGFHAHEALRMADRDPGEVEISPVLPTLSEFAEEWRSTDDVVYPPNGERLTRRQYLAKRYNRSVWWVDKQTKEARARGLLPKPDRKGHTT